MDKLSRNLTKIDVLLDKLGLLHEGLKGKDEADLYDLKLVRKYADELAKLLDQVLDGGQGTPETKPYSFPDRTSALPKTPAPAETEPVKEENPTLASNGPTQTTEPHQNGKEEPVTSFSLNLDEEPDERITEEVEILSKSEAPTADPVPPATSEPPSAPTKKMDPLIAATAVDDDDATDTDVNYRFREEKPQVLDRLKNKPISSLQREIGLNERFWFATELFDGDGEALQQLLKELDTLPDLRQAELTLDVKGRVKYDWSGKEKVVQQFMALVQRRFQ
jgi:hypothetical protein